MIAPSEEDEDIDDCFDGSRMLHILSNEDNQYLPFQEDDLVASYVRKALTKKILPRG